MRISTPREKADPAAIPHQSGVVDVEEPTRREPRQNPRGSIRTCGVGAAVVARSPPHGVSTAPLPPRRRRPPTVRPVPSTPPDRLPDRSRRSRGEPSPAPPATGRTSAASQRENPNGYRRRTGGQVDGPQTAPATQRQQPPAGRPLWRPTSNSRGCGSRRLRADAVHPRQLESNPGHGQPVSHQPPTTARPPAASTYPKDYHRPLHTDRAYGGPDWNEARERILPVMRYLILGESLGEREQDAGSRVHWWRDLGPRP